MAGNRMYALLLVLCSSVTIAQEGSPAKFVEQGAYVAIYQRDSVLANQGICVVEFGFNGQNLSLPIEDLTFTVRVLGADGKNFGTGKFALSKPLGGNHVSASAIGYFDGQDMPELMEFTGNMGSSPLCLEGVSLVFESAIGKQAGRFVDLVRYGQLRYTTQRLLKVKINEPK